MVPTVRWKEGAVHLWIRAGFHRRSNFLTAATIAQSRRPFELKVRGAPAISVTAAMGVALGAQSAGRRRYFSFVKQVDAICDHLAASRPTAVNLFWAIARMKQSWHPQGMPS